MDDECYNPRLTDVRSTDDGLTNDGSIEAEIAGIVCGSIVGVILWVI